jgi:hypothetical protein
MSTASITHHPVPIATVAAAAVAALAFGALTMTQDDTSPSPVTHQTTGMAHGNPGKHSGAQGHIREHGGTTQLGLP